MDQALPRSIRLSLEQALDQWQHWRPAPAARPLPVRSLGAGRSNTSVLVGEGPRHWVVRIDGVRSERLGLNRDAEWRALENAAAAGLAPQPVYRNPALGVVVCSYLETSPETVDSIAGLARLLRSIQSLPAIKFRLDPLQRARRYLEVLGERELPAPLDEACAALQPTAHVLCHNDLLRANRVPTVDGLLALDWEYAAMGDPLFELAVIVEGDGLTEDEAQALHQAWLGEAPSEVAREQLLLQRSVYRELATLWERAMDVIKSG